MVKLLPPKKFEEIYSQVPRLCVDLIIRTHEGILLSKRKITPWKGMWHTPGGTVLFGEHLDQCTKRIAKSETGLDIEMVGLAGIMQFPTRKRVGQAISIVFVVKVIGGELRKDFQSTELKFFKTIPENTIEEQKRFLDIHKKKW